jgi:hypothetical protein
LLKVLIFTSIKYKPSFLILGLLLFCSTNLIFAQEDKSDVQKDNFIEQRVEQISENSDNPDIDYSNLLEELQYFQKHPINLNTAKSEDLKALNILTEVQIISLLRHIENTGKLVAIYELQAVENFTLEDINKIKPFVYVSDNLESPNLSLKNLLNNGSAYLVTRVSFTGEDQKGFQDISDSALAANPNAKYLGSKYGSFSRFRYTYGNYVSIGITADKDPGEQFLKGAQQNGYDFYSAHLFLRNYKFIKALAIGDYQAQFGQGLTFWMGLGYGKTSDPMLVKRSARGITPSNSINENLFLRGGATTIQVKKLYFTAFYSENKVDATINSIDTLENTVESIASLQLSGLHRTPKEVAGKNFLTQYTRGGNVSFKSRSFSLGVTAVQTIFGINLDRNLVIYNQYDFSGKSLINFGTDYNWVWRNINVYGEVSRSNNGGLAQVHGAIITLDPRFFVSVLYRNYGLTYQNLNGNGVGENTRNNNERGILTGMLFKPNRYVSLAGYYDRFVFPYLKYQVNAPTYGNDYLVQLNYNPSKKTEMYARVRKRLKAKNNSLSEEVIQETVETFQTNYRFNVIYKVNSALRLRSRVDVTEYKIGGATSRGFMIYQDVNYNPNMGKFSFNFRYGIFNAEDFYSRIYAYENDVPYSFYIPAFSNKGTRTYITLNYSFTRHFEMWFRVAQTWYSDVPVISEGTLNEINANHKTDFKIQARYKF